MADDAWLIEGVVQFLRSPIWQMPVMGFIDQQCLVFDQDEENKLTYTEIHKEYQKLVEIMLESFLKDIGIKTEDFVKACKKHQYQSNASIMTLFEQIEAAQDFEIFKRMMIRQNVELELQALSILQARHGIIPTIMLAEQEDVSSSSSGRSENEDDKILNEILRKSKEEYEALKKQGKEQETGADAMMEQALAKSQEEAQRLKREMEKEEEMFNEAMNLSLSNNSQRLAAEATASLPPLVHRSKAPSSTSESKSTAKSSTKPATPASTVAPAATATSVAKAAPTKSTVSGAEAAANWLSSAKAEAAASEGGISQTKVPSSEAEEMKKRAEYLKKQRDVLIEMKRKVREKNFKKETESQSKAAARPKSARAARQATSGEVKPDSMSSAEQEKKLKMRLALADRLKKEVIGEM